MSIQSLVDWATANGAALHPSVEVYQDLVTGLSFRVKPDVPQDQCPRSDESIVSIPTTLSLSYVNALDVFPASFLENTRPHVISRFFLIAQYLAGRDSFWWPYIQALPQPADKEAWELPPFWEDDDVELFDGTNLEVGIGKIRSDILNEFSAARTLFSRNDHSLAEIKVDLYQWAYSIFSSRSFRPSLVLSETALPPGVAIDDFSVLLPLFDIGNHDMEHPVNWDVQDRTCSLHVEKSHAPGQQIYNNYSLKTNAELLLGYGFMIPATENLHNDYIHVRKRAELANSSDEYLVSLRPTTDRSSLLGSSRQRVTAPTTLSSFTHLQHDMVLDIFHAVAQSAQQGVLSPQQILSGDVGDGYRGALQQVIAILQHKMLQELERLEETEVEVSEDEAVRLTRNQRLALDYRARCRQVLENTLESIATDEFMNAE